jgi:hypothetical protein
MNLDTISKDVQDVVNRAAKMEEERLKAQTRFETAKEALIKLGYSSLAEAKEKLECLATEITQLGEEIESELVKVKAQLT